MLRVRVLSELELERAPPSAAAAALGFGRAAAPAQLARTGSPLDSCSVQAQPPSLIPHEGGMA
jgi:hypothetical protein